MKNVNEVLYQGYDFRMGKYLGDGWDIFKKGAGNYIGFTVVFLVMVMIISMIPFVNMFVSIIEYVLMGGIFIYTRKMINGNGEFGNFFEGFNFFGQILLFLLVMLAFMLPFIVVFILFLLPEGFVETITSGSANPQYLAEDLMGMFDEANISLILTVYSIFLVFVLYLYTSYSMTLVLIVDRNMRFWDAMETSRKVVAKNFFSFLGMYILLGLMLAIGIMITCGLGTLVAFPYLHTVVFAAYDDILGPGEDIQAQNLEEFGSAAGEA